MHALADEPDFRRAGRAQKRLPFLPGLCLAIALHTSAAAAPDTTAYQLPTTVITATRATRTLEDLPQALSLIDSAQIQQGRQGLSLEESLRRVPGLHVADRHNPSLGDRLSIRGLGARASFGVRGIKVVLDGIPLTLADGQTQLNNLDLGSASRIEVLRGPSSALYGNAAGGVISIHTQQAAASPLQIRPQLLVGSFGLRKGQLQLSGAGARHSYLLSAYALSADGFRQRADLRARGFNAVGRRRLGEGAELRLVLNLYDAPYQLNPSTLDREAARTDPRQVRGFVAGQGAAKQVRQAQAGLSLHLGGAEAGTELAVYGLDRSLLNPIPGRIVDVQRTGFGLRAVHNRTLHKLPRAPHLIAGVDFDAQEDDRREFANEGLPNPAVPAKDLFDHLQYGPLLIDQDERVRGLGPFARVEVPLGEKGLLSLGGRYDRYTFEARDHLLADGEDSGERTLSRLSPALGMSWRLRPLLQLYAGYATAFQTPTTSELGNRPDGSGGFNPDLEAEKVRGLEAGLRGHWPAARLHWEAALFQLDIDDMLIPYQVPGSTSEEIYFRNAGQARHRGLELSLSLRPRPFLRAELVYAHGDFAFVDYQVETQGGLQQLAGNEVAGVPPQRLFAGLRAEHPRGGWAEVEVEWVGAYFASDFNGPPPSSQKPARDFVSASYARADLRLGLRARYLDWFAGLDNLFAARYSGSVLPNALADRFFEPAPGRRWYLGASTSFPDLRH